jgi:hypothetical protein
MLKSGTGGSITRKGGLGAVLGDLASHDADQIS